MKDEAMRTPRCWSRERRGDEGRGDEDSEELVPWLKRRSLRERRGDDRRGDEDSEVLVPWLKRRSLRERRGDEGRGDEDSEELVPWLKRRRGRGDEGRGRGDGDDEGRGDKDSEELAPWPKRCRGRGDEGRGRSRGRATVKFTTSTRRPDYDEAAASLGPSGSTEPGAPPMPEPVTPPGAYLVPPRPLSTAEPVTPPSTSAPVTPPMPMPPRPLPAPPAEPPPAHLTPLRRGSAPRGPAPPAEPPPAHLTPPASEAAASLGAPPEPPAAAPKRLWPNPYQPVPVAKLLEDEAAASLEPPPEPAAPSLGPFHRLWASTAEPVTPPSTAAPLPPGAYLVPPRPLSTAEPVTPPSTAAPVPAPPAAPPPAHLRLGPAPRGPAPPAAPSVLKCCLHPKCYYRQHASGAFGGHCCGRCRMWLADYPYNKPVHGENCKHIWYEPPREASPEVIDVPSYPRPSDTEMAAIVSILSSRAGEILGLGPISAENFQV